MRKYLIACMLWVADIAFPSALPRLLSFDDYVNAIYQRQNFEDDFESVKQALREAYATPLDLNKVTVESLAGLGILSSIQIKNYFNHLAATGPLYSKYELQAIPDFDLATITLLLPFVYVTESYHLPSCLKINKNRSIHFLFRYTPAFGSTAQRSTLGRLDRYTIQISCDHNHAITWGITARKQAGESFCWDHATHRYGFNLWSIFVMVNNKKYIKRMVIGDYQMGYGQGLVLSAGYIQTGDSINALIRSNNLGIRPYKGITRIGLRGVAITSDLGPIELTGLYASNNLDATLKCNANNQSYTNRIDRIGRYDTAHNLDKKGTINEQLVGCTLRKAYHRNQTEVGINLLYTHYDIPIIGEETDPYWSQSAASLFYRLLWKNWTLFGEAGLMLRNRPKVEKALITGCVISLSRYIDLSGAIYYYGKGWHTPYGNAFKRYTSDGANEKGGYACFQFTPLPSWHITTSGHFFTTLVPKPQLAVVSSGYRFIARSNYTWNRATLLVVQYKLHKNPHNKPKEADLAPTVEPSLQNSLKFKLDHKVTHNWWTTVEIPYTCYTFLAQTHHGYALAGTQKWKGSQWQLACKVIYFKTSNYATRLYFYSPSPLYSGTQFHPYYGHGMAMTCLVSWKPIHLLRLEIKYNLMHYIEGLYKTEEARCKHVPPGKSKHSATIQLLIRF